jgi:hypothetical protein
MENLLWSELKQLFTYSPIHLFTFLATPLDKQFIIGNRLERNGTWTTFLWSELKHLFTYSPIHFLEIK